MLDILLWLAASLLETSVDDSWRVDLLKEADRYLPPGARALDAAGLEKADLERADVVVLLDAPGLDVAGLLRRARVALRPGGRLILGLREAGWSLEGMLALLTRLGYGPVLEAGRRDGGLYLVVVGA